MQAGGRLRSRRSRICLDHPDREPDRRTTPANARSITGVLAAGVEKGHTVKITAEGPDEKDAVERLQELLAGLVEPVGE